MKYFLVIFSFCLVNQIYSQNNLSDYISGEVITQCQSQCKQSKACLENCQKLRSQHSKKVLYISLSVVLFCLVSCGCCMMASHPRFRKCRLIFNTKYQALKRKYNKVNNQVMSRDQFIQHLTYIVQLFNESQVKQNFVSYSKQEQNIEKVFMTAQQVDPFLYKIDVKGQDNEGHWSGSGFILCNNNGVVCWFLKQYDESTWRLKGRAGKYLYKSNPSTMNDGLQGVFYNIKLKQPKKQPWKIKTNPSENTIKHSQSHQDFAG